MKTNSLANNKPLNFSKKVLEEIISELWENAAFNPGLYELLEKIGSELENKKEVSADLIKEASYKVSTLRNRFIIDDVEQDKLKNTTVAFFGLSVGSHAALTWMMESKADIIKISDPDIISPSNLNRLRLGWDTIGKYKVDVLAKQLADINPLSNIITFNDKSADAIQKIITIDPLVNIIVDEMDDLECKVRVRQIAREKRIPVLMATDVGDNVFLDIERYDIEPLPKLFNGRIKNIEEVDFKTLSLPKFFELIKEIVGMENNSEKMLSSLLSIGKTIKTQPQLASAATISGGVIATAIKKIVLGEDVKSGRYYINLDQLLDQSYISEKRVLKRQELSKQLKEKKL